MVDLSDEKDDNKNDDDDNLEDGEIKEGDLNTEWRHLYSAMSMMPGGASTFFWLGSHSVSGGAAPWRWANSSAPLQRHHASWRDGKPEFGRNKCLLMQDIHSFDIEDSWRDYRCTAKFRFVCELHIPTVQFMLGEKK